MTRILTATVLFGALTTLGLAAEPASRPAQIDFKFKFEPGRVVRHRVETRSVGSIKLPAPLPEQKFTQTFQQVMTTTCQQVNPDGSAEMKVTLDEVVMKMSMGAMAINFDSRTYDPSKRGDKTGEGVFAPPAEMVRRLFSAMVGASFTMTLSESGQPLKIEGLSASIRKALQAMASEGHSAAAAKALMDQLGGIFDDSTLNDQMQSFYRMSPPQGAARIGEKWEQSWGMKVPMVDSRIEGKGEYELISIQEFRGRPCAKIRVKENYRILPPDPADRAASTSGSLLQNLLGSMNMELSTSGGDGTAYIDYQRGELVQLRQSQNMTIRISFDTNNSDAADTDARGTPAPPLVQQIRTAVRMDLLDDESSDQKAEAPDDSAR
ncbi:MAG: hypothetical protein AMXMBFR13_37710 [Phycisphaerae bacterium]